jgi:hypothetical protein
VFGDSKLVISWMEGRIAIENLFFQNNIREAKEISGSLSSISYSHIFRGKNKDADLLSK